MKALVTANLSQEARERLTDHGFDIEYAPIGEREAQFPEAEFVDRL